MRLLFCTCRERVEVTRVKGQGVTVVTHMGGQMKSVVADSETSLSNSGKKNPKL